MYLFLTCLSILLARQSIRVTYQGNQTVLPLFNTALQESIIKSRIRLTLQGHGDAVRSAVYSPDSQRIVTASGVLWSTSSGDKTAKMWDAR